MKRSSVLVPLVAVASLVLPVGVAFGQQPPAPVTVLEKRFEATAPPGSYDEVLFVLDLAPGTEFPSHSHGGPVFLSVVEGTLWDRSGGEETVLNAGDTLTEEAGRVHAAGNDGPGMTRLLITVLLPKGAQLTTDAQTGAPQELPPGATVAAQAVLETPQAPAPLDVVQRATDLPAGAVVPQHTHPGPNFNILI
jgi:quercetin dioxygenase-like cupin family protein